MQKVVRLFASLNAICCEPDSVKASEVPSEAPSEVLVLFHGYGASAEDLLPIAPTLVEFLPTASLVFLEAPEPYPDASIAGARAWFPLQELSIEKIVKGLQAVEGRVLEAIEAISSAYGLSLSLPFSRIALLGFSQGGMVALNATCSADDNSAFLASVGIATTIVQVDKNLLNEKDATKTKTPILMIHGDCDQVVPIQQGLQAAEMLREQGYNLQWHERKGMGHEIDQKTLQLAGEFLAQQAKIQT